MLSGGEIYLGIVVMFVLISLVIVTLSLPIKYDPVIRLTEVSIERGLGPCARAALKRPANYAQLSAQEQWEIDRNLEILDWDGDPRK